jgi:hypothetical protein
MAVIYNAANLHDVIAHMPGVKAGVYEFAASKVFPKAQAIFAPHNRPGGHEITHDRGVTDTYVNLEGPVPHIVEWGRASYVTDKDQPVGGSVVPKGTVIGAWEGTHVLRRTYESF